MKCRIIIFYTSNFSSNFNFCIQFFSNLSGKCSFRSFTRLNFTTREFPSVFKFSIPTLCRKNFIAIFYHCCYNLNCFHVISSPQL